MKKLLTFVIILLTFMSAGYTYGIEDIDVLPTPCSIDEAGEATCSADISTTTTIEASELSISDERVPYVLFHLDTCPHCIEQIDFIERVVRPQYGDRLQIELVEVSDPANAVLYREYAEAHGVQAGGVPAAFIGDEVVIGYSSDEVTGRQIVNTIEAALSGTSNDSVIVPILGNVDARNVSLPLLTLVLGLLDGFNPCAMWVLIFLISLLIPMQDPKRRWLLGSLFILTSGLSYFIFMAAWLQLILFIGVVLIVRILIGSLAVGVGFVSLRDFWRNRHAEAPVCKVSNNGPAKNIFAKLKSIVHRDNIWWAILGITLLGFSINLVELACSAGFPALFTQILAISQVSSFTRYAYMALYIFFYMLDDMVVFGAAMLTLRAVGSGGGRYAKYAQLISGILMLILGVILIFSPELLMFT